MPFLSLPNEIILGISTLLPPPDVNSLLRTCGRLAYLLPQSLTDSIFRFRCSFQGRQALYTAVRRGNKHWLQELLSRGILKIADPRGTNRIICYVMATSCEATIRLMLDYVRLNTAAIEGDNPVRWAAASRRWGVFRVLLACKEMTALPYSDHFASGVAMAFLEVVADGQEDFVKDMLRLVRDDAIKHYSLNLTSSIMQNRNLNILKLLVADGRLDPNINDINNTPFIHAVTANDEEIVRILLTIPQIDVNSGGNVEAPPLHSAIAKAGEPVIRILLEHPRTNPTLRDRFGRCALHAAAAAGSVRGLKILLSDTYRHVFAAWINARDHLRATPLHLAARRGHTPAVQFLLEQPETEYLLTDSGGRTPLHVAAEHGDPETIRVLLDHGARYPAALIDVKDEAGLTPLRTAEYSGHGVAVKAFLVDSRFDFGARYGLQDAIAPDQ